MLKNISNLGTILNKSELKTINGMASSCYNSCQNIGGNRCEQTTPGCFKFIDYGRCGYGGHCIFY